MFLLTEGPRLFYVDAANMVLKGEIPWLVSEFNTKLRLLSVVGFFGPLTGFNPC